MGIGNIGKGIRDMGYRIVKEGKGLTDSRWIRATGYGMKDKG